MTARLKLLALFIPMVAIIALSPGERLRDWIRDWAGCWCRGTTVLP